MKNKMVIGMLVIVVAALVVFIAPARAEMVVESVQDAEVHADTGAVDNMAEDSEPGDRQQIPVEMNKDDMVKEEVLEQQEPDIDKPAQWEIEMMEEQKREKMEELEMERKRKADE